MLSLSPSLPPDAAPAAVADAETAVDEASILAALGSELARFKQPKRIFIVDELPRNTMGKVQKNVLRETYSDLFAS